MNTEKPLIALCFGLAACAGQPTIPNSTPAVPTVRATQVTPEMIKNGEQVGYKPQLAHGEVTYCRRATPVGSHMSQLFCINAGDFEALLRHTIRQEDKTQQDIDTLKRTTNPDVGGR